MSTITDLVRCGRPPKPTASPWTPPGPVPSTTTEGDDGFGEQLAAPCGGSRPTSSCMRGPPRAYSHGGHRSTLARRFDR